MPDPKTIERLRGLVLSAGDLRSLTNWPDALIEDYLNIVDNLILLANTLDVEIDQKLEEISTDFINGSVPFVKDGLLIEDNVNIIFNNITKVLTLGGALLSNLTASRLLASDDDKNVVSIVSDITDAELEALTDDSMVDTLHRHSELSASDGDPNKAVGVDDEGRTGFGVAVPLAVIHLKAGTAVAGNAPIKFEDGTLLATPECGTLEFAGSRTYITNVAHQRAIDRTSDVAVATVTVENTAVETTVWTATMAANSLVAGNIFKFNASGHVQNGGPTANDQITFRIKVGGTTIVTMNPVAGAIAANTHWHLRANATQRTIGVAGERAIHLDLKIDTTIDEIVSVAAIDTTANMDVTLTAQWASADVNNIFELFQASMEYKN